MQLRYFALKYFKIMTDLILMFDNFITSLFIK